MKPNPSVDGNRIVHYLEGNKCSIKCLNNHVTNSGSVLIVGKNGGMQWRGNPNHFAKDFRYFCDIMSANLKEVEFIDPLCTCKITKNPLYPSGVSRINTKGLDLL